jgi:hypothetical protein
VWIYKTNHANIKCVKNGLVGVHSTMSSSIHDMPSILAQFQLQEQVKKNLEKQ